MRPRGFHDDGMLRVMLYNQTSHRAVMVRVVKSAIALSDLAALWTISAPGTRMTVWEDSCDYQDESAAFIAEPREVL